MEDRARQGGLGNILQLGWLPSSTPKARGPARSSYLAKTFLARRVREVSARCFRSVRPGCRLLWPRPLLPALDEPRSTPVAISTSLINSGSCQSANTSQDLRKHMVPTRAPTFPDRTTWLARDRKGRADVLPPPAPAQAREELDGPQKPLLVHPLTLQTGQQLRPVAGGQCHPQPVPHQALAGLSVHWSTGNLATGIRPSVFSPTALLLLPVSLPARPCGAAEVPPGEMWHPAPRYPRPGQHAHVHAAESINCVCGGGLQAGGRRQASGSEAKGPTLPRQSPALVPLPAYASASAPPGGPVCLRGHSGPSKREVGPARPVWEGRAAQE